METIIKDIEAQIDYRKRFDDGPDEKAWGYEIGILLSANQAKQILDVLKDGLIKKCSCGKEMVPSYYCNTCDNED